MNITEIFAYVISNLQYVVSESFSITQKVVEKVLTRLMAKPFIKVQ